MNPFSPTPGGNDPTRWVSPFEELLGQSAAYDQAVPQVPIDQPASIIGTPGHDLAYWDGQQRLPDDCAIKCQQFILHQFTGHYVDEGALVQEAAAYGWYQPGGGTPVAAVGNLLELHGVGVHRYQHANQFNLAMELAQGHKVIVGVDSARLHGENPIISAIRDAMGTSGADHAVVVSGIDTSDPLHVRVIVSDPGTGEAVGRYPLEQFLDAWRGSDFFMVATNDPAPPHLPEMAHFDYSLGHIPEIADVSYDQFLNYTTHPADWSAVVHHYVDVHHFFHYDALDHSPSVDVMPLDSQLPLDAHGDLSTIHHPLDGHYHDQSLPDHHANVHHPIDTNDGTGFVDGYDGFSVDDVPPGQMPDDWN